MQNPRMKPITTVRAGHGVTKSKAQKIVEKTHEEILNDLIAAYNTRRGLGDSFYRESNDGAHTVPGFVTAIKLDDGYGVYKILDSEGNAEPIIKKVYSLQDVIVFFEGLSSAV